MKSIMINQKAFQADLFFAFCSNREVNIRNGKTHSDGTDQFVETLFLDGSVGPHLFTFSFRKWNSEKQRWDIKHEHSFSRSEAKLNSIEGLDILATLSEHLTDAVYKYQGVAFALWEQKP